MSCCAVDQSVSASELSETVPARGSKDSVDTSCWSVDQAISDAEIGGEAGSIDSVAASCCVVYQAVPNSELSEAVAA